MGVALYIALEKQLPDFDSAIDGQMLSKAEKQLAAAAKRLGMRPLEEFFSVAELDCSAAQWFSAEEGLKTVDALLAEAEISSELRATKDDLSDCQRVLREAKKHGVRWRLAIDQAGFERGRAQAKRDIEAARPRLFAELLGHVFEELFRSRFGIKVEDPGVPQTVGYYEGYNSMVIAHIDEKHGAGAFEKAREEIERLRQEFYADKVCVRCGKTVNTHSDHYELFEKMHWLCFHLEFEHQGDLDSPCSDPSCPWRCIEVYEQQLRELGQDNKWVIQRAIERRSKQ